LNHPQTLRGSLSAALTPISASKYSFETLDEIYKIYMSLPRSDFKISANRRPNVFYFSDLKNLKQMHTSRNCAIFALNVDEILFEFRDTRQWRNY